MQDTDYFDGVDLDRPSIKHAIFEKMQANARAMQSQGVTAPQDDLINFFDSDVRQTLRMHNTPQDRVRLNNVIRALFSA